MAQSQDIQKKKRAPARNFPKEVLTEAVGSEATAETIGVHGDVRLGPATVGADAGLTLLVAQGVLATLDRGDVESVRHRLATRGRPVPGLDEGRAIAGAVDAVHDAAAARKRDAELVGAGRDGVAVHVPAPHTQRRVHRPNDEREGLRAARTATTRRPTRAGAARVLAALVPGPGRVAELSPGGGAARAREGAGGAARGVGRAGRPAAGTRGPGVLTTLVPAPRRVADLRTRRRPAIRAPEGAGVTSGVRDAGLRRTTGARGTRAQTTVVGRTGCVADLRARGGAVGAGVARVTDRVRDTGLGGAVRHALAGQVPEPVRAARLLCDEARAAGHAAVHRRGVGDAHPPGTEVRHAGARGPLRRAAGLVADLARRTRHAGGDSRLRVRARLGAGTGVLHRPRVAVGVRDAGAGPVDAVRTADDARDEPGAASRGGRAGRRGRSARGAAGLTRRTRKRLRGVDTATTDRERERDESEGRTNRLHGILHQHPAGTVCERERRFQGAMSKERT